VCPAGASCTLGNCLPDCGPLTQCGSSCVDVRSEFFNCGGCGQACPLGEACVEGSRTNIDAFIPPMDGAFRGRGAFLADLKSDSANCGACGHACADGQACQNGACTSTCVGPNLTLCAPGSCVNTQTSTTNCGACGAICAPGQLCVKGACADDCGGNASFKVCGGTSTHTPP